MKEAAANAGSSADDRKAILDHISGTKHGTIILKPSTDSSKVAFYNEHPRSAHPRMLVLIIKVFLTGMLHVLH